MKNCEIPQDILIGHNCRTDKGRTIESCYLYQAINLETPESVELLLPLVQSLNCSNRSILLEIIAAKTKAK